MSQLLLLSGNRLYPYLRWDCLRFRCTKRSFFVRRFGFSLCLPLLPSATGSTAPPTPFLAAGLFSPALFLRRGSLDNPPLTRRQPNGKKLDRIGRRVLKNLYNEVCSPLLALRFYVEVSQHRKIRRRGGRGWLQPAAGIMLVEKHPRVSDSLQQCGCSTVCRLHRRLSNFKNRKSMKVWHTE
jgi:hypothetical protein